MPNFTFLEIFLLAIVLLLLTGCGVGLVVWLVKWANSRIERIAGILSDHANLIRETGVRFGEAVQVIENSSQGLQAAVADMSSQVKHLIHSVEEARTFHEKVLSSMTEEFARSYADQYEKGSRELAEMLKTVAQNSATLQDAVKEIPKYEAGLAKMVDKLVIQVGILSEGIERFRNLVFQDPGPGRGNRDAFIPYSDNDAYIKGEKDRLVANGMLPSEADQVLREDNEAVNRFMEEAMNQSGTGPTSLEMELR